MARRNPPARYTLPNNLAPSTFKCFRVSVPDDPFFIAAFRGQMLELGSALAWADDPDHKALQAAATWREVIANMTACSGGIIPIACPYDFQFGDDHDWHPIVAGGITYAAWTGAGWQAGYLGTTPTQPYYQLQIYHDIPLSEVYSYTIEYTCLQAVQANVAPDFSNQGPYPPGVHQVIVVATTGSTDRLRIILTTLPQTDPGTQIVVYRVIANIANSLGSCT